MQRRTGLRCGKKVNGRKRHILVDTIGLLLTVHGSARQHSGPGWGQALAGLVLWPGDPASVKHIWADGGYAGLLIEYAKKLWRCTVEVVKRNELHTFKVLPRRWVVERTFGWLGRYRRLNRDYEAKAHTGEIMVYLAMIRLMLARLGRP